MKIVNMNTYKKNKINNPNIFKKSKKEESIDDNPCHILKESELDEYLKDKTIWIPPKEEEESVKEEPVDDNPCHILKESELDEYLKGRVIYIPPKDVKNNKHKLEVLTKNREDLKKGE